MLSSVIKVKLFRLYQVLFGTLGSFTVDEWLNTVRKYPNKEAIVMIDGRSVTFNELNQEINRIASILLQSGIKCGDTVSIILENSPEYFATWYAILKIGAECAFINTNLKSNSLAHVLKISTGKTIIIHEYLLPNLETIDYSEFDVFYFGEGQVKNFKRMDLSKGTAVEPPSELRKTIQPTDPAIYVYTSGTTGMPKAAVISHTRLFVGGKVLASMIGISSRDRMYICLPMYHSSASILGIGTMVNYGTTVILSKKFSASQFTSHCKRYNVTGAQYIGELCRYLMNTPASTKDKDHKLKFMAGNGLGADIWLDFKKRFGIGKIAELYAATEGNIGIFNVQENNNYGVGAVGRLGLLTGLMSKRIVVKVDLVTGEAIRNAKGLCQECKAGETGEFIGQIKPGDPQADFKGYKGEPERTEGKILRNVFRSGDAYFKSGDLVKYDKHDFIYFVDRIGDTFRWKGENVSTLEVAKAFTGIPGISEANVYGVHAPGHDGRAGMAALCVADGFLIDDLFQYLSLALPSYAIPVFIRIAGASHSTGTFKQIKTVLREEGCNPNAISDELYLLQDKKYVKMATGLHDQLKTIKL
ncbi:Fatty-acid-CoA ligase FadD6 [Terramyces sp. JEL0728]|nr:Fatty-acid-CoA ligase FadD6 [Terramyces sp. JEL0728]